MKTDPKLSFVRRWTKDVLVLEVIGDLLSTPGSHPLREELYIIMFRSGHRKILLNLARLRRTDTTTVGLLVAVNVSVITCGCQLKMCCIPPNVTWLLAQLHLNSVLEAYKEESQALDSFLNTPEKLLSNP